MLFYVLLLPFESLKLSDDKQVRVFKQCIYSFHNGLWGEKYIWILFYAKLENLSSGLSLETKKHEILLGTNYNTYFIPLRWWNMIEILEPEAKDETTKYP